MLHTLVSFCLASFVGGFISAVPSPPWIAAGIALCVALTFGILRGARIAVPKATSSVWNLSWDLLGAIIGVAIAILANYYVWRDVCGNLIE